MRLALPMFGEKISPRFDCAARLLIVEVQGGAIRGRREESIEQIHRQSRIGFLLERKVNVLLCGGIRRRDYFSFVNAGIDVYAGLTGEAEDVLEAFLNGRIPRINSGGSLTVFHQRRGKGWGRRRGRSPE